MAGVVRRRGQHRIVGGGEDGGDVGAQTATPSASASGEASAKAASDQSSIACAACPSASVAAGCAAISSDMRRKAKQARIAPVPSKRKVRNCVAPRPSSRATSGATSPTRSAISGTSASSAQSRTKNSIRLAPVSGSTSDISWPAQATTASIAPLMTGRLSSATPNTTGTIGRPQRAKR